MNTTKIITQGEYNKLFEEYLSEQMFNGQDWDRFYSNHVFWFNKKMIEEGFDVCPGFHVNEVGERIDES